MKKIVNIFLVLLSSFAFGQQPDPIAMERIRYKELAAKEADDITTRWDNVCDDETIKNIQSGIALGDKNVNDSIVEILYLKMLRFSYDTPLQHPNREGLIELSSINGLEDFILEELSSKIPNWKLFKISTIMYNSDEKITDRLLELARSDSRNSINIIGALIAGNLIDKKFEPIILEAITSKETMRAFVAARYLKIDPIPSALPALIEQYQRPSNNLEFMSKTPKVNHEDLWRKSIGEAILSYNRSELIEFSFILQRLNKSIDFQRLSRPPYEQILKKISET